MGAVVVPANGALTSTAAASADGSIAAADAPMTIRRIMLSLPLHPIRCYVRDARQASWISLLSSPRGGYAEQQIRKG